MFLNGHIRRVAGGTLLGIATFGAGGAGALSAAPASAATMLAQVQSLITCGTTTACVSGSNTSSGPGVAGTSVKGWGVSGTSTSSVGVMGTSNAPTGTGVYGQTNASGSGVTGYSPHGYGMYGASSDGYGMFGSTGGTGIGVLGNSVSGVGVQGHSLNDFGVYGLGLGGGLFVGDNVGLTGQAGKSGAYPLMLRDENGDLDLWVTSAGSVIGSASGTGSNGIGADFSGTFAGIIGRSPVGAYPLELTDDYGNQVFSVDALGNVMFHGGLYNFARTAGGATVKSFSPKMTLPTVEDTGTAQLVAGAAVVRLDPTFAASIDARSGYRVFLTPNGDTRGLFIATKTVNGFIVRESQGGRATISFDYRIVATAVGQAGERMALTHAATAIPRAAKPIMPKMRAPQAPTRLSQLMLGIR